MSKNKLDFIVIGTAKSGTTSLYELLKSHPQIMLPSIKEAPFFSDDKIYGRGVEWYFSKFYGKISSRRIVGSITPQYTIANQTVSIEKIAKRIYEHNPRVKLMCILRHPVERSFSHYQMLRQRGYTTQPFEDFVLSRKPSGKHSKRIYDEAIQSSKYFSVIKPYLEYFDRKQIIFLYTDDLRKNPGYVIKKICDFLGADKPYNPNSLDVKARRGGSSPKLRLLTPGFIYSLPFVEKVWLNYVPYGLRKKMEYKLNLWNTKKGGDKLRRDTAAYKKLCQVFKQDISSLENNIGLNTPWDELK